MSLILASYNIHRCYGNDGRHDPSRIRQVLRELDAQIIALQEVELLHENPNLLKYFCEDSPWTVIPGLTLTSESGHYGNALLSSLPVINTESIDLSVPGHEPRTVISALLEYNGQPLHVLATHLGLRPGERRNQARRLLSLLHEHTTSPIPAAITVLMGDLNEWFLWGRPLRWLHHYFQPSPAPASYPAYCPLFALDRIWVKPYEKLFDVKVVKNKLTKLASDHLPLIAEIK